MSKVFYGVSVKQGKFRATKTVNRKTNYIAPIRSNMRDAVLDIPVADRKSYARWV